MCQALFSEHAIHCLTFKKLAVILQWRKLIHRKFNHFVHGHTDSKEHSWDLNPGLLHLPAIIGYSLSSQHRDEKNALLST